MIKLNKSKGFTLIELLTVIAIMAILASISIGGFEYSQKRAAIKNDKALVNQINRVLKNYGIYEHSEEKISKALIEEFGKEIIVESYKLGYDIYLNTDLCEFDLLKQSIYNGNISYISIGYYLNLIIESPNIPENDFNTTDGVFCHYTIKENDIISLDGMTFNLETQKISPVNLEISNYSDVECSVIRVVTYDNYEFAEDFKLDDNYIYFYRPGIYKLTYTIDGNNQYKILCIPNTYFSNILSINIDANSVNYDVIYDNLNVKIIISNYLRNIIVTEYNQKDCNEESIDLYYNKSLISNIDIIIEINNIYKYTTMNPSLSPEESYEFLFNDIEFNSGDFIEITYRYFGLDGCWHFYNHKLTIN